MVLPALPALQRVLHTTPAGITWLLTGYLLSASVATPILGCLGDRYGKQRILVLVFGALLAGCLLAALASSLLLLIVARVIQGAAGAIFPLAFSIVRDEFPARRVAGAIGLLSATIGIGAGLGMALGGVIVAHLSYHWLFWLPLIPSALAGFGAARVVPRSPALAGGRLNVGAAVLLSGWLVLLLLGVSEGPVWGWRSTGTVGLLALSVVVFIGWIRVEVRAKYPLVDIAMMRIPTVWWVNLTALLMGVQVYAMFVVVPPFLQAPRADGYGFGFSVTMSGLVLVPGSLSMLAVGLLMGRITRWLGSRVLLVAGAVIASVPFVMLTFAHGQPWEFWLANAVNGFGIGLAFSAMPALIMQAVPPAVTGVATGMNTNIRTVGGAIGSQVIASIIASHVLRSGVPAEQGYAIGFALLAVSLLAAAGAAAAVPAQGGRSRQPEPAPLVSR
jgi:MFS family permease